jgi:hypothetical protein
LPPNPKKKPPDWYSAKTEQALAALLRIGWGQSETRHRILERSGWPDFLFAYRTA